MVLKKEQFFKRTYPSFTLSYRRTVKKDHSTGPFNGWDP